MTDLNLWTDTEDRMELLDEVRTFGLGRLKEQINFIGSRLSKAQAEAIRQKLNSNRIFLHGMLWICLAFTQV